MWRVRGLRPGRRGVAKRKKTDGAAEGPAVQIAPAPQEGPQQVAGTSRPSATVTAADQDGGETEREPGGGREQAGGVRGSRVHTRRLSIPGRSSLSC